MNFEKIKQHLKVSPDEMGARHPGMSAGWLVFWRVLDTEPEGGFFYHLNPYTFSEVCFPLAISDEARTDWVLRSRPSKMRSKHVVAV
jgi:hypothetical protein